MATTQSNLGPTGTTFDSLQDDIRGYAQRGGESDVQFNAQLPRLVNRTERSIADRMKILGVQYALVSKTTTDNPVVPKPDGWRNTISINVGLGPQNNTRRTLRARSYEYLRSVYPDDSKGDAPKFYADYNQNNWIFGPRPDNVYPFEALVWRLPDLLSASNQRNYLTEFYPNLLLYGCLVGLEPFLRNDARMGLWKTMLDGEFQGVTSQDMQRTIDRGQTRGPPA